MTFGCEFAKGFDKGTFEQDGFKKKVYYAFKVKCLIEIKLIRIRKV